MRLLRLREGRRCFLWGPEKEARGQRKCISCTAAAASKSTTGDAGSGVAARSASAASTGAAHREASSQGADDALSAGANAAATAATEGEHQDAASGEQEGTTRACSACGKQLAGTVDNPQDWKRCGRCQQAFYCDKACQVAHWKRGGHKQACKEPMACCICLDNDGPPLPIQGGCGCREEAGCAHVACKVAHAKHQGPGYHPGWYECPTCKQHYTGAMQRGLAEALWARLKCRPAEDQHRLYTQNLLVSMYRQVGRNADAEALCRDLLATTRRVHGPNDANTLVHHMNLGSVLLSQGKHSDAEAVFRDTLERQRQVLGPEHEHTLSMAGSLAAALQNQGKYAEAEPLVRGTLAIQQRVLGEGHPSTLTSASNLAVLLSDTGQHAEAEKLSRSALAQANRTLGPEHPSSLQMARALAVALGEQGQTAEAEALFAATLATQQRLLGQGHPDIQNTAQDLRRFQQRC